MLNVLKKVEKLRRDVGGGKSNGLEPPKNLPDLARDMYEHEQQKTVYNNTSPQTTSAQIVSSNMSTTRIPDTSAITNNYNSVMQIKSVSEPNKDSVPGLDLSLIRQHLAASQSAIQSVPISVAQSQVQTPTSQVVQQPASRVVSAPIISQPIQSVPQSVFLENQPIVDDSTGFFKEFEEYIRNNGLSNDIVGELLDKSLLDHMMFYHTTKGDDMPFYASSVELSHAIKVKLEDLQSLERTWISNKQKLDLMKKWGTAVESDIHLKSEELKKMIAESRKRGGVVKSTDFFQIVKPKLVEPSIGMNYVVTKEPIRSSADNIVATPVNLPLSSKIIPSVSSSITEQSSIPFKYTFNNYVTADSSKYFYALNGQVFKSVLDLMNGLEIMDGNTFNHHVNDSKNDFSNWIKGVFGDFRLSDSIRPLIDRERLWHFLRDNIY